MELEREITCCFTGHRPDKLPWGDWEKAPACQDLKRRLNQAVESAYADRPCETQANSWPEADRRRYQAILDQCDLETLVQHHYDRGCMMRRNRYMVDRSSRIIAVYDGVPKGGTAQTLAYAMRQGLKTEILSLCQEEST